MHVQPETLCMVHQKLPRWESLLAISRKLLLTTGIPSPKCAIVGQMIVFNHPSQIQALLWVSLLTPTVALHREIFTHLSYFLILWLDALGMLLQRMNLKETNTGEQQHQLVAASRILDDLILMPITAPTLQHGYAAQVRLQHVELTARMSRTNSASNNKSHGGSA